jgi:2-polyprenyl-3-methyl-5-hydroxy-6-metoxy-1,4-benzoquinol methylase
MQFLPMINNPYEPAEYYVADEELQDLMIEAIRLSNAGTRTNPTATKLYASYHLDKFTNIFADRCTLPRLNRIGMPPRLDGKTVLELASNTGAISLELASRGAKVIGLEYNDERVDFCNRLAKKLELDATFKTCDLNWQTPEGSYDIVVCGSVDAYLKTPLSSFTEMLSRLTKGTCFFESNNGKISAQEIKPILADHFPEVTLINVEEHRKTFLCSQETPAFPVPPYGVPKARITKDELGRFVRWFEAENAWAYSKWLYQFYHHIPAVSPMTFPEPRIMESVDLQPCRNLDRFIDTLSDSEIDNIRYQFLDFYRQLNKAMIVHHDLWLGNLILKDTKLYVLDWDLARVRKIPYQIAWASENHVGRDMLACLKITSADFCDERQRNRLIHPYKLRDRRQQRPWIPKIQTKLL